MEATKPVKKQRLIGSMLALILGVLTVLAGVNRLGSIVDHGDPAGIEGQAASASFTSGLFMILGSIAYRSRKRRLLGLRSDTRGRLLFEVACLSLLTLAWLALRDLELFIRQAPVQYFVIPVWALAAYPCAGLWTRFKQFRKQN